MATINGSDLHLLTDIFRDTFVTILETLEKTPRKDVMLQIEELKKIADLYGRIVEDEPDFHHTLIFFYMIIDTFVDYFSSGLQIDIGTIL